MVQEARSAVQLKLTTACSAAPKQSLCSSSVKVLSSDTESGTVAGPQEAKICMAAQAAALTADAFPLDWFCSLKLLKEVYRGTPP